MIGAALACLWPIGWGDVASAQQAGSPPQAVQAGALVTVAVPAGPLEAGVLALGRQANLRMLYPSALTAGRRTGGVSGRLAPQEAVARLLAGTGLRATFSGANTVRISDAAAAHTGGAAPDGAMVLDTIDVQGRTESAWGRVEGVVATRSASATKTDTPLLETPQSISVVTADQITQQGTQSIGDVVRYSPGTRGDIFGVSTTRDYIRTRGFSPTYYQDGLILPYGITGQGSQAEPYGMERVEILRGPASVMFGQTPPGGIINMISKRPSEDARREVFVQGGTFNRLQGGFDLTGPANAEKTLLYRVVGMGRLSDTQVNDARDDRFYIAPSLTWRNETTTLTVLGQFQRDRAGIIDQYFPAAGTLYGNPHGRISSRINLGEPGVDRFRRDLYSIGYELTHRFDNGLTFRQNARYAYADVYNASTYSMDFLADNRTLTRNFGVINRKLSYFTIDNQLLADVSTGPLQHRVIVGLDYRYGRESALNGSATAPDLDVFAPVYGRPMGPVAFDQKYAESTAQVGVYVQDQIRFDRWRLTLGGRLDGVETRYDNHLTGERSRTYDRAFTGRAGLSYLFDNGLAPYVAYSTSFEPVLGVTSVERGSRPFRPTQGRQFEAGVKYQPVGLNALFTLAYFDLVQSNVQTTDPDNIRFQVQTGEVRAQGFEFEARANLTEQLSLIAAYSYINPVVTKSNDPQQVGRQLQHTPQHQASIWAQYAFQGGSLNGVTVGAGMRYIGANFGDTANLWRTPDYTLFDASLTVDLGKIWSEARGATFQVNATNIFDRQTITGCFYAAACMLGQRRTVLATLRYRW